MRVEQKHPILPQKVYGAPWEGNDANLDTGWRLWCKAVLLLPICVMANCLGCMGDSDQAVDVRLLHSLFRRGTEQGGYIVASDIDTTSFVMTIRLSDSIWYNKDTAPMLLAAVQTKLRSIQRLESGNRRIDSLTLHLDVAAKEDVRLATVTWLRGGRTRVVNLLTEAKQVAAQKSDPRLRKHRYYYGDDSVIDPPGSLRWGMLRSEVERVFNQQMAIASSDDAMHHYSFVWPEGNPFTGFGYSVYRCVAIYSTKRSGNDELVAMMILLEDDSFGEVVDAVGKRYGVPRSREDGMVGWEDAYGDFVFVRYVHELDGVMVLYTHPEYSNAINRAAEERRGAFQF